MREMIYVRSLGYFSDDATREFQRREIDRLADLCGPEIGHVMGRVGWNFVHGAHAVVTARDASARVKAIGWAIQTNRGVSMSYAVARGSEGCGLGRIVASMAIVEAQRQYGNEFPSDMIVHAQWRESNYGSETLAYRLGLKSDASLNFSVHLPSCGDTQYRGASAPAKTVTDVARRYLAANGSPQLLPIYTHSRFPLPGLSPYEVSSAGDKRFSALFARLKDGRTIEEAYQLDVKGYRDQGNDWKIGKGKPSLRQGIDIWAEYKALWQQWAKENQPLMRELAEKAKGKCLTDKFASSPISQARALAEILNSYHEPVECADLDAEPSNLREKAIA